MPEVVLVQASLVGPAGDRVWEALGGGPSDLYFPDDFLGEWKVESTLTKVSTPLGEDFIPDLRVSRPNQILAQLVDHRTCLPRFLLSDEVTPNPKSLCISVHLST